MYTYVSHGERGELFALNVRADEPFTNVRGKAMTERAQLVLKHWGLGKRLEDREIVNFYVKVFCREIGGGEMDVMIMMSPLYEGGNFKTLDCDENFKLSDVSRAIEKYFNVPANCQGLIFHGILGDQSPNSVEVDFTEFEG